MVESFTEIIKLLGERYRAFRITCQMTQKEVSEKSCVSITTIHNFESGKMQSMDLRVLFILMRTLGLERVFKELIPDLTESPYVTSKRNSKMYRRVRK